MTTERSFLTNVRHALDLETDALALRWSSEAVATYLNALDTESVHAEMLLQLPDHLFKAVKRSHAAAEAILPEIETISKVLDCSEPVADHLLRVVWAELQNVFSPSDIVRMKNGFPAELLSRIAEYDALEEEEEAALRGDVANYEYEEDPAPEAAVLSGGDVDADWKGAEGSGEETVGGSVITPDQDVVDEIGEALGVTYRSDEALRPVEKEADRDRFRWELDPASSEDFRSRNHPAKKRSRNRRR